MRGLALTLALAAGWLGAQTPDWLQLKNADADQLFEYGLVDAPPTGASLPLAARQRLAPGETRRVAWSGQTLVGVFVPWKQDLSSRTVLGGGTLLPAEAQAGKQVALSSATFAALNRTRALSGTLLDWGLRVPQFALDGRTADWNKVKPLATFGPGFPSPLRSLQVALDDNALWLLAKVPSVPGSLALVAPGLQLELPWSGDDPRLWRFPAGDAVGARARQGAWLEAWVPLERLAPEERQALLAGRLEARSLVEKSGATDNQFMTDFSLPELP